ncbi:hypothetical protein ACRE_033430 [Hapsidospora chrysogenum ATCC 11550]|uniref:Uncharacterized protein n=1 Tax=Hapsidospora chrysogenum (strain ATCC 11550 / CBS 779.69 / DSM 880 / IAM 14645 / JCM 23072 / IMI 49137) TaxID=857340 RepID=A0A086T8Z9_HAPC1|nr:hypothetical protein ACRE_033430 [Hapsidospora chrysogenum ATCC 11550]
MDLTSNAGHTRFLPLKGRGTAASHEDLASIIVPLYISLPARQHTRSGGGGRDTHEYVYVYGYSAHSLPSGGGGGGGGGGWTVLPGG